MDRIGVVGLSWREGGAETIGQFTVDAEALVEKLPKLAEHLQTSEVFYLSTCNRVEVGFVAEVGTPLTEYRARVYSFLTGTEPAPGVAEKTFRLWGGGGAAEHMFLVAAGLDSAKVGETEILGQLRRALDTARQADTCGARLGLILEESLKVASKVREATQLDRGRTSLAEIALERTRDRLAGGGGSVALVGVSPMTERCGRALGGEGVPLIVVNRTLERARAFAAEVAGDPRSLEQFREDPDPVEVVILATGAPVAVLTRATLERLAARAPSGQPPLIIDLAIPADVDPDAAAAVGLPRLGMDGILAIVGETRDRKLIEAAEARVLVDQALAGLQRQLAKRLLDPIVAAMRRRYRETAEEGLKRLFKRDLKDLGDAEKKAIERWAQTLAQRFAHVPTEGLKAVAAETGLRGVRAFVTQADASLAEAFAAITEDAELLRPEDTSL